MSKVKILSLNTWNVPFSTNKKIRFEILKNELRKGNWDFVLLQEIILRKDYDRLKKSLGDVYNFYPQSVDFINKQGGLLLLAKYRLGIYKYRFYDNMPDILSYVTFEKVIRKGFQWSKVTVGNKILNVINTHLKSPYLNQRFEYKLVEKQLCKLIHFVSKIPDNEYLIVGGDFNFPPCNCLYEKLIKETKLIDPLHGTKQFTHDVSNLNQITLLKFINWNKREDYTLMRGLFKDVSQKIVFKRPFRVDGREYHISDHYGVETSFVI